MKKEQKILFLLITILLSILIIDVIIFYPKNDRTENLPLTLEEQEKALKELLKSNPPPEYTKEEMDTMQKELEELNKINSAAAPQLTEEERIKMQEELEALINNQNKNE
ncbi:MAG: hypothetical protein UT05_C0009G0039 [Parcubacteria group bacterium GW2011_GWF2_38_76]|nr:MAG: hypothetical protein UT05_C0009G0039 [Parcubacteria group bacterium GW2011_GWF2_38_76]HBM45480.1 hypothetical protein [Patescibacteria group bacterium]